jgi:hypothetical protein
MYDKYLGKIDWAYSTYHGAAASSSMPLPELIEIMENDYVVKPVRSSSTGLPL